MQEGFDRIAVCGAGAMGAGIAQVAARAGARVVVLDRDEAALARGRASVDEALSKQIARGKLDADGAEAVRAAINWTLDSRDLAAAELVIEAIVENADAKAALYRQIEKVVGDHAVIATNTSSLSVTALASGLARPERFLGLHFFNPAPIMKLVEVVRGLETRGDIADACTDLMKRWGKVAVAAADTPGFIVNRVARPFYGEAWRALEEQAGDAASLDFLYRELGRFRMGPFELGDLIGHDVNATAALSIFNAFHGNTRFRPSLMQARLAAAGRLGRKTGRGVYDHAPGAAAPAPRFEPRGVSAVGPVSLGPGADRLAALFDAGGVEYRHASDKAPERCAGIDGVYVSFTEGKTARAIAGAQGSPALLLDWISDVGAAGAIAFAASDEKAVRVARDLAAALGKKAVRLSDRPGLVVFRTLAQLANCAGDAARDRIGEAGGIDAAMRYGVNYPFGPLAWARDFGEDRLATALAAIASATGDDLYRPSEWFLSGGAPP